VVELDFCDIGGVTVTDNWLRFLVNGREPEYMDLVVVVA
jgi:hypothetical protein